MLAEAQRLHLTVVLVRTRNPLNIGAAARAISNFGFAHLRVVLPYELAFREARSAAGAAELLRTAEEYENVADAVADCSLVIGTTAIGKRQLQQQVRTLPAGAKVIRNRLGSDRVAILFGSEKTGLSNQELSHCHWLLHIPTSSEHLSMNLAQAVVVTLYELSREAPSRSSESRSKLASAAQLERLTQTLAEAASESGFFTELAAASRELKLRRLIRRLRLQEGDTEVLLAMVRQMLWKMKR